jgi:malate dehydrogenase (oxaloacetate-decarboxylating)(NADP+)
MEINTYLDVTTCRSVLMEHFEELLPIVSIPTVREACQKYGLMFKSLPRGLFVTLEDRGRVFRCGCRCN